MQLYAVIVPPSEVVRDALEAARDLMPQEPPAPAEVPSRGFLDRLRGHLKPEPPATPVAVTLSPAGPDAVFVLLAKFGNVTADDAAALAKALGAAADTWRAPVLHVSRLAVTESAPYDVAAGLDGDVDALRDIHRNVNEAARLQRFFLDRRTFRSELALGSVAVQDGAAVPDSVAGAEIAHRGPHWSPTHITLLRSSFSAGATFAEVARIELADGAHTGV